MTNKISILTLNATTEQLRAALDGQGTPAELRPPVQAVVKRIVEAAAAAPLSAYVFADEGETELRDLFAHALVRALRPHLPDAVLVDCAFMQTGLSGIVPQRDALGFLDLLLYGSSLDVITQDGAGGVRVIGAGSFPVTKKMPVVREAFDDAARRLLAEVRCAVFVGPLRDDTGDPHPLIGAVRLPLLLAQTTAGTAATATPVEEMVASRFPSGLVSVRVDTAPPAPVVEPAGPFEELTDTPAPPPVEPPPTRPTTPPPVVPERPPAPPPSTAPPPPSRQSQPERERPARKPSSPPKQPAREQAARPSSPPKQRARPPATKPSPAGPPEDTTVVASRYFPKVATGILAVVFVIVALWWLFISPKPSGDGDAADESAPTGDVTGTAAPAEPGPGGGASATDTTATAGDGTAGQVEGVAEGGAEPADTVHAASQGSGGRRTTTPEPGREGSVVAASPTPAPETAIDPERVLELEELQTGWRDQFVVHISSFREPRMARAELRALAELGFSCFIVRVEVPGKGVWHRVYAGPVAEREAARALKISLDEIPRVKFTRITRVR